MLTLRIFQMPDPENDPHYNNATAKFTYTSKVSGPDNFQRARNPIHEVSQHNSANGANSFCLFLFQPDTGLSRRSLHELGSGQEGNAADKTTNLWCVQDSVKPAKHGIPTLLRAW